MAEDYARRGGYYLIEDAAESFGGSMGGRPAGSFGDISCISFFANKICTAGEGGAVLTDDPELDRRMRTIANHGITSKDYAQERLGLNARMTDMQAAVLCAQLERMPQMIERRRQIMIRYYEACEGTDWELGGAKVSEIRAPWLFAGVTDKVKEVMSICEMENIEARPFFPIPSGAQVSAETRSLSQRGVCLPLFPGMTEEEIERVCEVISSG